MKLPSLKQAGNEGLNTLARIGGATAGKLVLGTVKKTGLLYSLAILCGGLVIAISGPDKFKLQQIGEGLATYGGLKVLNDLSQPTIDWGLGSATPAVISGLALPESIRSIMHTYVPSIDGLAGMGYSVSVYPADRQSIPAFNANYKELNGVPALTLPPVNRMAPGQPSAIIEGVGMVPVLVA